MKYLNDINMRRFPTGVKISTVGPTDPATTMGCKDLSATFRPISAAIIDSSKARCAAFEPKLFVKKGSLPAATDCLQSFEILSDAFPA